MGVCPRTREQRRAVPTAGEVFIKQHVEVQHVEKNGTQCFKSGSQRQLDNKFDQDESNVIINTNVPSAGCETARMF